MILLVEKQAMSLVGSNSNLYVPLLGIYLALKTSVLGAMPPGERGGGAEGCCARVLVCAEAMESGEGQGGRDGMKRSQKLL